MTKVDYILESNSVIKAVGAKIDGQIYIRFTREMENDSKKDSFIKKIEEDLNNG